MLNNELSSGHLNKYFKSSPEESQVNQNQHSTLRSISCWNLKSWSKVVFFSCYYLLRQRVLLCRKVLEVQLYEFWLKSGLIKYQQGHLERIFLANFCKIFFRFEGSLLANCTRQSVEEDHYGNWYTKCIVSTILFLLPSRLPGQYKFPYFACHARRVGGGRWEGCSL